MENQLSLGPVGLEEAKRIQSELSKVGVEIFLDHNDEVCTRGCRVTVEVKFLKNDLEAVKKFMQNDFLKQVEGLDINFDTINAVFDPSQKEATCPACSTVFATDKNECPECGLVLG